MYPHSGRSGTRLRTRLAEWYLDGKGRVLRDLEADWLNRNLAISFNHRVLQIGALGWEEQFLDSEYFSRTCLVDDTVRAGNPLPFVRAECDQLPIASESVDSVILAHCIEFASDQHSLLREAERVLKPEGKMIILGFNPWSFYRVYHYIHGKRGRVPWCGSFIGHRRMHDWLGLLNFELCGATGFNPKTGVAISEVRQRRIDPFVTIGYGIRAIKRRYTLIPLASVTAVQPRLAIDGVETRCRRND